MKMKKRVRIAALIMVFVLSANVAAAAVRKRIMKI